jgi:SAM-dependent methyltransferase
LKRIYNILRFGVGPGARERKRRRKEEERHKRFDSELWEKDDGLARRQYDSYDDYVEHQASKLDKIIHRLKETEEEDFVEFRRRFEGCESLASARNVLCLGARLGTEVRALHSLGYFAIGIDLNPGENNPYVLPGDFHRIVFPDGSVDAIYCNALDHVYDLDRVMGEVRRLLRADGLFVADLLEGFEEGFVPGAYEATHWKDTSSFVERLRVAGNLELEGVRDLGYTRRDHWLQAVFRKTG